jgi:hypothetical protein
VLLSHTGYEGTIDLIKGLPGIDIAIAGHGSKIQKPVKIGNTIVTAASYNGEFVGIMTITWDIDDRRIDSFDGVLIHLGEEFKDDPGILDIIRKYSAEKQKTIDVKRLKKDDTRRIYGIFQERTGKTAMRFPVTFLLLLILISCTHMVLDEPVPIKRRVAAFWEAKVQRDWARAYDFLCNAYKAQTTKEDYISSADLRVLSFKIEAIDLHKGGKKAIVTVSFDTIVMGFEFKRVKIKDEWINEDGAWRICPTGGFKEIFEKK